MDRNHVYLKIRELKLQEEVKKHYGDNYTRISTDKLKKLIEAYTEHAESAESVKVQSNGTASVNNPYEAACLTFVGVLKDAGLLDEVLAKLD